MDTQAGASRKKKPPMIIMVVLVVVLAAGAGLGVRWWQTRDDAAKPKTLPAPLQKSQELSVSGDFEGARQQLDKALKNPNLTDQQKYELYYEQGATYYNERKYAEALESYKKAAAFKETQGLYVGMAIIAADQLGDKAAAIEYYKKAIELISDSNPVGGEDKAAYEERIRELGGQP